MPHTNIILLLLYLKLIIAQENPPGDQTKPAEGEAGKGGVEGQGEGGGGKGKEEGAGAGGAEGPGAGGGQGKKEGAGAGGAEGPEVGGGEGKKEGAGAGAGEGAEAGAGEGVGEVGEKGGGEGGGKSAGEAGPVKGDDKVAGGGADGEGDGGEEEGDKGQQAEAAEREDANSVEAKDSYTSVALIDIVFTDGCRRTCTGAIIHDNVIITAAHCFTMLKNVFLRPELGLSFIVIGTMKMFETGYETYLPIEKVITHSRFNGWTADLALVFTYANMRSEKSGTILPLAFTAPMDTNVTVLSWGRCKSEQDEQLHPKDKKKMMRQGLGDMELTEDHDVYKVETKIEHLNGAQQPLHNPHYFTQKYHYFNDDEDREEMSPGDMHNSPLQMNPYHPNANMSQQEAMNPHHPNASMSQQEAPNIVHKKRRDFQRQRHKAPGISSSREVLHLRPHRRRLLQYDEQYQQEHNSRRDMDQKNNLTVGIFSYVNVASCKKIVERTLPPPFEIKNKSEALCYSSDEFYITNEDSGAPVIQGGELVAITLGGVDSTNEHVAVGIRISCFCSWIAENLPNGDGSKLKCRSCTNEHHRNGKKHKGKTKTKKSGASRSKSNP